MSFTRVTKDSVVLTIHDEKGTSKARSITAEKRGCIEYIGDCITDQTGTLIGFSPRRCKAALGPVTLRALADLMDEVRESRGTGRATAEPVTLDSLKAAWETATTGRIRVGDTLIENNGADGFTIWTAGVAEPTDARAADTRILARAPEPTNQEQLFKALGGMLSVSLSFKQRQDIATILDNRGVKAPEVDQ